MKQIKSLIDKNGYGKMNQDKFLNLFKEADLEYERDSIIMFVSKIVSLLVNFQILIPII